MLRNRNFIDTGRAYIFSEWKPLQFRTKYNFITNYLGQSLISDDDIGIQLIEERSKGIPVTL